MKYTLVCEREESPDFRLEVKFDADYIGDVFDNLELFLRGVGFHQSNIDDYLRKE